MASWAFRSLVALIIFIALVICCVLWMDLIRFELPSVVLPYRLIKPAAKVAMNGSLGCEKSGYKWLIFS